jgi:hypothetical protein
MLCLNTLKYRKQIIGRCKEMTLCAHARIVAERSGSLARRLEAPKYKQNAIAASSEARRLGRVAMIT